MLEKVVKKIIGDAAAATIPPFVEMKSGRCFLQPTQWRISKKIEPMPHFICERYFAIGTFRPSHSVKTIALIGLLHNLRPLPLRRGPWLLGHRAIKGRSLQHTRHHVYIYYMCARFCYFLRFAVCDVCARARRAITHCRG